MFKSLMSIGFLTNIHSVSCDNNGLGKSDDLTFLWSKDVNLYILDSIRI